MAANLKKQIDTALLRTDLTDEQKAALKGALADLDKFGTNFRKVSEIQRSVMPILRPGMGFYGGGRGGMGGQAAEPGTYAVKLTVGGKVLTGKVTVRLDPIAARAISRGIRKDQVFAPNRPVDETREDQVLSAVEDLVHVA